MISELLMNLKEFAELGCSACEVCKNYDIDDCPNLGVVREAILLIERQGKLLQERSDGICELRRNWTAAEMKICSMCGKFLHGDTDTHKGDVVFATDGNGVVVGTRTCGELIGYPRCRKFTPWISVKDRLPDPNGDRYLVVVKYKYACEKEFSYDTDVATYTPYDGGYIDGCWNTWNDWDEGQEYIHVTHWMPLPEPMKEADNGK